MDTWIAENPKVAAYIIYLSVVVVLLSLITVYYYTKSQEHLVVPEKKKPKSPMPKPASTQESNTPTTKGDFTIIEEDD